MIERGLLLNKSGNEFKEKKATITVTSERKTGLEPATYSLGSYRSTK